MNFIRTAKAIPCPSRYKLVLGINGSIALREISTSWVDFLPLNVYIYYFDDLNGPLHAQSCPIDDGQHLHVPPNWHPKNIGFCEHIFTYF